MKAAAGRGIERQAALQLVPAIVHAARKVNANPLMQHTIERVALFGSVMSGKRRLGDLDVAVDLVERPGAHDQQAFLAAFPIPDHAPALDRMFWPAVVAKCSLRVRPEVQTLFWDVITDRDLEHRVIFDIRQSGAEPR